MTTSPRKPCANVTLGCPNTVELGTRFCKDCARGERSRYDRERRPAFHKLYRSPRWTRIREEHIEANPFCVDCGDRGTDVDHVVPHRGDTRLFFDRNNLATRCKVCHSRKTANEVNARRGGGSRNFRSVVQGNARPGDKRTNHKTEGRTSRGSGAVSTPPGRRRGRS